MAADLKFHLPDRGRVTVGLAADLLLVAGDPSSDVTATRNITGIWRRGHLADRRVIDTRYDTDHVLSCRSRRLVDVCTELRLDVTQPELRGTSMTALHRAWLTDCAFEARDRVSVLNLRHSLSTALVALRITNRACWTGTLNVNRLLATELDGAFTWLDGAFTWLDGAFTWLDHPTFTDLL